MSWDALTLTGLTASVLIITLMFYMISRGGSKR
jgi:hypothetical protein